MKWVDCKMYVEGTHVSIATVLLRLVDMEPPENGKTDLETLSESLGVDRYYVYRSLRSFAHWLKMRKTKCPKCGSVHYGPDGTMVDTCWDCGFIADNAWVQIPKRRAENPPYAAMSAEEFAVLRETVDKARRGGGVVTPFVTWVERLSRALDVIERVTDERDRCAQARLVQMKAVPSESLLQAWNKLGFRCRKCNVVFPADGNVKDDIVTCPDCKATWLESSVRVRPLPGSATAQTHEAVARTGSLSETAQADKTTSADVVASVPPTMDVSQVLAVIKQIAERLRKIIARAAYGSNEQGGSYYLLGVQQWLNFEAEINQLESLQQVLPVAGKPVEKRCGTCYFGTEYVCLHFPTREHTSPNSRGMASGGYLTQDDGPPWPNCRFWKVKEKK